LSAQEWEQTKPGWKERERICSILQVMVYGFEKPFWPNGANFRGIKAHWTQGNIDIL